MLNGLGLAGDGGRLTAGLQSAVPSHAVSPPAFLFLVKSEDEHPREALPIGPLAWHRV